METADEPSPFGDRAFEGAKGEGGRVDFFIVGAMRSGTSSLRDALALNPHISMAKGEPQYFSKLAKFPGGVAEYHEAFDWGDQFVVRGDKSPTYAVSKTAPINLRQYNPAAKIVWTLRDPAKRAVSHFQHSSYRLSGKEAQPHSLRYAIEHRDELEEARDSMAYLFRSEYHKQISEWFGYFPRENHHIIILEEMLADPETHLRALHKFLDVPWHEALSLPHTKKQKMADFVEGMHIDPDDIAAVRSALRGTKAEVEQLIGRDIPSWGSEP